ncbi:hypothetical protein PsorP6_017765 [Peronosclerospora sorghi]|uniref:Uncharacterized protein n=1 Tax=Peronosclerospora sorghi TaxID=230839 RepID=A0ACC0WNI9_9STRA|nr:hypothetical protein PsorP6_017765 [Peronosclerospora sorghi]
MPVEVERLATTFLRHPSTVKIRDDGSGKNKRIDQRVPVPRSAKEKVVVGAKIIVFVNIKKECDVVAKFRASLWCFRLILLLKKESGLSSVKKHFENLHFSPDFMLAIAVFSCGVPGQESLGMLIKLLDYSAYKVMGEDCSLSTIGSKSCQSTIFLSQVLALIAIAGLVYEKQKDEMDEPPPTILMECATK